MQINMLINIEPVQIVDPCTCHGVFSVSSCDQELYLSQVNINEPERECGYLISHHSARSLYFVTNSGNLYDCTCEAIHWPSRFACKLFNGSYEIKITINHICKPTIKKSHYNEVIKCANQFAKNLTNDIIPQNYNPS